MGLSIFCSPADPLRPPVPFPALGAATARGTHTRSTLAARRAPTTSPTRGPPACPSQPPPPAPDPLAAAPQYIAPEELASILADTLGVQPPPELYAAALNDLKRTNNSICAACRAGFEKVNTDEVKKGYSQCGERARGGRAGPGMGAGRRLHK